jgi:hypothetical protein
VPLIAGGIASHLAILATWLAGALTFVGIGTLLQAGGPARATWRDVSTRFWLGIGGAMLVLQVWHLFLPVDGRAVLALVIPGIAGLWRMRREPVPLAGGLDARRALLGGVLVAWVANRALGPTTLFDTGMYHQPVVAWTNSHAIVPGLGNLHGRLAFNSASLLLASVFDVGPLDGAALHVANGLLSAVLLIEGVCAWQAARGSVHPRAFDLFSLGILPNVVHGALRQDVRSLSTDAAVCALLFAATRLLFDHLAHLPPAGRERARRVPAIVFAFTAAVTVKLSAAMLAASGALLALWTLREARNGERLPIGRLALWLSPAVALFGVWLVRGAVLSGYPVYPARFLALAVDWRVPAEQAAAEAGWITMSARNLNSNVIYPGLSWIWPWMRGVVVRGDPFAQLTVPALLTGAVALAVLVARRREPRPLWSPGWARIALPLGMGIVFWLASAPHTRMAQGLLWSAAAIALAWWCSTAGVRWGRTPAHRLARLVVGLSLALVVKQAAGTAMRAQGSRSRAVVEALLTLPHDGRWMAALPAPELAADTLVGGLVVAVPVGDNACWNTSALCTPHPSATLRLRRSGLPVEEATRHGFRSEGDRWAPRRWPNPWTPFLAWWRCVQVAGPTTRAQRECLDQMRPPAAAGALSAGPAPASREAPAVRSAPPP